MRKTAGALTLAFLASASLTYSATETYTIDPAHSNVGFSIRHFFSKVPGRFTKFSGTLTGDPANLQKATVTAEIDAASIDTDNETRDNHLRSADFFDVTKYPTIKFESKSVAVKSANSLVVTGDLTMHGVTKSVDLQVDLMGSGPDAWGGFRAGFEARTTINRKDFGIVWNKVLDAGGTMLGDDVEIVLGIEAVKQK